jgi:hypothetical protein
MAFSLSAQVHSAHASQTFTNVGTTSLGRVCLFMKKDPGVMPGKRRQDQAEDKVVQKAGLKEQQEAAKQQQESPGEPAGGE